MKIGGIGVPLHGFIFDLDGVLTDTAAYHYQAWQRLADALGIPFDRVRNEALRGVSRRRSLALLLAGRVYPFVYAAGLRHVCVRGRAISSFDLSGMTLQDSL